MHTLLGWRQPRHGGIPVALSNFFRREVTCCSLTLKPAGNVDILEARSRIILIQSGPAKSARESGMLILLAISPGGGGGINRREQALKVCSSPSSIWGMTGCTADIKARTYLFASVLLSKGSGKSCHSKCSKGFASLTYAHLQLTVITSYSVLPNKEYQPVLHWEATTQENHEDASRLNLEFLCQSCWTSKNSYFRLIYTF